MSRLRFHSGSRSRSRTLLRRALILVMAIALLAAVGVAPGAAATAVGPAPADAPPSTDIEQSFIPLQVDDPELDGVEDDDDGDDAEADEENEEDDEPAEVDDAVPPDEVGDDDEEEEEDAGAGDESSDEGAGSPYAGPGTGSETGTEPPEVDDDDAGGVEEGDEVEVPEADGAGDEADETAEGEEGVAEDGAADGDAEAEETADDEEDDDGNVVTDTIQDGQEYAGDVVDGATPDWTPESWMESLFGWTFEDIMDGIAGFIDLFSEFLVGVPAPGDPLDPLSWYFPEDDPVWETVLDMYWTLVALSTPLLTISVMQAMALDDPKRREQMLKENMMTVGMYFAGPLVIGLTTHTADVLAAGIAPSGEEFLASPEDIAQLGVGTILGFLIAIASPLVLAVGVAIIVLVTVVILISAAAWPLAWTARSSGFTSLRSMGNLVITSLTLLLILRGIQSIGLRFLFEIPLEDLAGGALVVFLLLNALGLYYLLYKLPRGVLKKTFAASAVTLGMSYMPRKFSAVDAARAGQRGYTKTRSAASRGGAVVRRRLPNNVEEKGNSGDSSSRPGASPALHKSVSSSGSGSSSTSSSGSTSRTPSSTGSVSLSDSGRHVGKMGRLPGRDRYRHMKSNPTGAGSDD